MSKSGNLTWGIENLIAAVWAFYQILRAGSVRESVLVHKHEDSYE